MKNNDVYPILVLAAAMMLSACGGGGGGGSSNTASNMPETQPETSAPPTNFGDDDIETEAETFMDFDSDTDILNSSASANASGDAVRRAATAAPLFGSVTQSSNVDAQGITTDHATGSFDGSVATITVDQADGGSFSFGEDSNAYFERDYSQSELQVWASGSYDQGRISYHARELDDETYHADFIGVIWDSSDPSLFLTWGYWLRSDGNPFDSGVTYELGTFVDGMQTIQDDPSRLPSSGTASYSGEGQGIYHHQYGSGPDYGEYAGAIEIGQYVTPIEVTVDFGQSSVGVCGACGTERSVLYGDGRTTDGEYYSYAGVQTAYRFEGTATLNSDGTFRSQQVTLTNPDKPVTSFDGSMGGVFSYVLDSNGNPQMVVGTTGGTYTHAEGEVGSYVGTFGARTSP